MPYELKKFNRNSAVVILLILSIALSVAMPLIFIKEYVNYEYTTGKEQCVNGIKGLELRKRQIERVEGEISITELNEALIYYKSFASGDEAYVATEEKYPGFIHILREAYADYAAENDFVISDIKDADDFYTRCIPKIQSKIKAIGEERFSPQEKEEALKRVKKIEYPYNYRFVEQWGILFKSLIFINSLIAFNAIIISNLLFSSEREKEMDLLLIAIGKKRLFRIAYQKMYAMIGYLIAQFLICNMITSGIVFGVLGISGWDSQLQIMPDFYTTLNNWTFGETYLWYLLISMLSIIAVASFCSCVNAVTQKTYVSLMVSGIIVLFPISVANISWIPAQMSKILKVHPINGINLLEYVNSLHSYKIGFWYFSESTMLIILSVIGILLFGVLSPVIFTKKLIE